MASRAAPDGGRAASATASKRQAPLKQQNRPAQTGRFFHDPIQPDRIMN
jgi:hypothetical protein